MPNVRDVFRRGKDEKDESVTIQIRVEAAQRREKMISRELLLRTLLDDAIGRTNE